MDSDITKTTVSFVELMHTEHSCKTIPYGIAIVASYALKSLGHKIDADLFKYTADFIGYLEQKTPQIACFSNYAWNLALSYEFAKQIKSRSPESIIVFGGPNYPIDTEEQEALENAEISNH